MQPELETPQLNMRELEILALIAEGLSNREIAQKLYLSPETVKWYNKQIFARLGAASRTQAVSIAKRLRLLQTMTIPAPAAGPVPANLAPAPSKPADQNRYKLGPELGRGGMGVVYQAEDTLLHRSVALKILSGPITEEGRQRLLHEAQAAARLNHPNIVSIFDAGEMNGQPFIVMELISGPSLYEQKPSGQDQIVAVALQICAALEHAHAAGIIHRDLKPENILLSPEGRVKILDFGLARPVASRLSSQGTIAGSVFYLAPEQALGQEIDGRADLYSLGVILYELVAGQLPFSGDDPLGVISQHLYAPVVPPSAYQAEAPALDAVILKLLAKNPAGRYASARQVMDALQSLPGDSSALTVQIEPAGTVTLLNKLVRGRMVGRKSEIERLRELWARAQSGQGHLALISGEPGIGKTRLANELIVYAQLGGATILRGGCYEYEATTPYLPFMEAFREWVHAQPAETIQARMGATASDLARLAPEIEAKLGPLPPSPALPPGEERLRLFDNVTRFLQNLAKSNGLLLFIDDLHWADLGTLSLLAYLLRNLRSERVLILAAYREVELDRKHPLAAALVEWNRERLATRISLERLTFDETSALLATLFGQENISAEFTQAMYAETEGNPFFLEEVVKALIEQGQIYRENNQWERKDISELAIPQSVKEAIGRRLNRLSEACLDVLHAAAVLGKEFDFSELAAVSLLGEDALLDALDEAGAAQLVRARDSERFIFTHDKIREVLYEEINPIRRKRLHQRIGEALENRPRVGDQATQELAHHFTQSGDLERSLKYSILAAEKASRLFALDDALYYYELAHEAAESLHRADQLASIHNAIGEIHNQRGQVHLSVQYFQRAIDLQADPEERGAIKARMGSVYAGAGDARGLPLIEEALQELNPETQANEVALATAMIGRYYHYQSLHSKAIEYLERARSIAEPLDNAETLAQIYAYLAGAYQHLTRFPESMAWAHKNIELGKRKNDPISEAYGYEFLAEDTSALGDWKASLDYAGRDREIGKRIGAQDRVGWSGFAKSLAKYGLGDLASAEMEARKSRSIAKIIGDPRLAVFAGGSLVQILTELDRGEEALDLGEQILREADVIQHAFLQAIARHYVAYLNAQLGNLERSLELFTQAEGWIAPTENLWMPNIYLPYLAQVYFDADQPEQASRRVERALSISRPAGAHYYEALALRVQAQLYAASGGWEQANGAIQDSLQLFEKSSSRLDWGRSLFTRGKIHQAQGNLPAALADWTRALECFTSLGALLSARKTQAHILSTSKAAA